MSERSRSSTGGYDDLSPEQSAQIARFEAEEHELRILAHQARVSKEEARIKQAIADSLAGPVDEAAAQFRYAKRQAERDFGQALSNALCACIPLWRGELRRLILTGESNPELERFLARTVNLRRTYLRAVHLRSKLPKGETA